MEIFFPSFDSPFPLPGFPEDYDEPLPPSVDDLLTWYGEMDYKGHTVDFEWAHNEIKNHLLGFVRVGLVAHRVKFYKLYSRAKQGFKDFRDYCQKGLGKSLWSVNCLIKAAKVVLELIQAGFTTLPQCEAQARPLTKFTGDESIEKWQAVIDSAPAQGITAAHVASVVDDEPKQPQQRQLKIDAETYSQLQEKANRAGLSVKEFLKKLVDDFEPEEDAFAPGDEDTDEEKAFAPGDEDTDEEKAIAPGDEDTDEEKAIAPSGTPITPEELTRWRQDVEQMLIEHYGWESSPADSS